MTIAETTEEETDGLEESTGEWQLPDHRREMTRVQNRRTIELGSRTPTSRRWR